MQYFVAVLRDELKLPSREGMLEAEKLPPGTPISKAHFLLEGLFDYYNDLALTGNGKPLPNWFEPAFWLFIDDSRRDLIHSKEKNLYIYDDGQVELR